jgi:hypothetical protein
MPTTNPYNTTPYVNQNRNSSDTAQTYNSLAGTLDGYNTLQSNHNSLNSSPVHQALLTGLPTNVLPMNRMSIDTSNMAAFKKMSISTNPYSVPTGTYTVLSPTSNTNYQLFSPNPGAIIDPFSRKQEFNEITSKDIPFVSNPLLELSGHCISIYTADYREQTRHFNSVDLKLIKQDDDGIREFQVSFQQE